MFAKLLRGLLPIFLINAQIALAQPATPIGTTDLRRHIDILAGDAFMGRAPGTEGETLTINYIADQLRLRGVEPAGDAGGWFQQVPLVERRSLRQQIVWRGNWRAFDFDQAQIALQGRDAEMNLANRPVIFVGHGMRVSDRGIDQLAGSDPRGAVILLLADAPAASGIPPLAQRVRALAEAGAAAVIAITSNELQWNFVVRNYRRTTTKLAAQLVPPVVGAMPRTALESLLVASGSNLAGRLDAAADSSFRAVTLPLRADMQITTEVRAFASNNVVGRLRGSGQTRENIMFLAHWDHFGICRPEVEADRICNGAVDNASGVAAMIEIAGRLAQQPRPVRDVLFLATTAEEVGLLGAEYFATNPPVPAASILAGLNLDTIAIHPAGLPVAMLGPANPPIEAVIGATVAAMGRRLDTDRDADILAQRHDGWALTRNGIPGFVVGGSFADMERVNAFLSGSYHGPDDEPGPTLELGGAAEDANLMVALGRRLADPAIFTGRAAE
ncbi:MAG: M28 family peptidase [Sphingosinicella sp.]